MPPEADLFGDPLISRSAVFNGPRVRHVLTREWDTNLPRALVIGNNPSTAGKDSEDNTSHWWNRWFMHWGYGAYDAMNLNPFITSDPAEAHRIAENAWTGPNWDDRDELHRNISAVGRAAKKAHKVFVCWGAIARDDKLIEAVVEAIQCEEGPGPDLWCWGKTMHGAPIHPMARGKHRIDPFTPAILWRAA
ncbi:MULTISPECIES: DUF1643 domain-containing protein [Sphingomonadales]|uniref:DUF1643 domain-containing protein n=1 Tax=Sphingomonadales TaxID=204457 RepID=UPI001BCBB64A|nr:MULTISPECIES: DUF1643 domain-containing protein [Sphingomonadales]MBS7671240.1 DUF1643 domain-containing protein [Croceicoccus gelatinilyticus]MCC6925228.1 DUF1643 domain-containing protein [Novosphingobium sp.]